MNVSSAKPSRLRTRMARAAVSTADRARLEALRWQGFRSRFVPSAGGVIHMLEGAGTGSGPTLVLLHGLSSCAADFGPMLRPLRRHTRRIVVPDMPGHGLSRELAEVETIEQARSWLTQALDDIVQEPAIVFGNSLGGFAALRYANARPERVRGLVLVSPGGAPVSRMRLDALLDRFRSPDLAHARAFIDIIAARPHWLHPVMARALRYRFEQPGVQDLLRLASTADLLRPEELRALEMPVLLLWGREEKLFGSAEHQFFRTHLPAHAVLEEPEGFGHAPFLDRPRALARRIGQFIERI